MKTNGSDSTSKMNQVAKKSNSLVNWLEQYQPSLSTALPKNTVDINRFMQSAKLAIFDPKQPNLARCEPMSIMKSLKESASLGLEVGGLLGQAYLIPYNEKGVMTCHFQMG